MFGCALTQQEQICCFCNVLRLFAFSSRFEVIRFNIVIALTPKSTQILKSRARGFVELRFGVNTLFNGLDQRNSPLFPLSLHNLIVCVIL
jgi:hypothetical protein